MTIRRPVIAGNWKLHHGPAETSGFLEDFLDRIPDPAGSSIVLFPPAISLTTAKEMLGAGSRVALGVQNVYWESRGAFTGEISAPLARDAGAAFALVGHSERRHIFGERDADCARKLRAVLDASLYAILCVGETIEEREAGRAREVVERQFTIATAGLDPGSVDRLLLAYEPVWAIGTGRTASPADAEEMHGYLRSLLQLRLGPAASACPILYGGSVKPENAGALLAARDVDGLLVGGASLEPTSFSAICSLATSPIT